MVFISYLYWIYMVFTTYQERRHRVFVLNTESTKNDETHVSDFHPDFNLRFSLYF